MQDRQTEQAMMTETITDVIRTTDIDGIAVKPSQGPIVQALHFDTDRVTIDFEGHDHVPSINSLEELAERKSVRVTVPIRADGFDPLGDDSILQLLPASVGTVLVAGHPAYLQEEERRRAIAPRLRAALETFPNAWVGCEGIEALAKASGATQFLLLSDRTEDDLSELGASGIEDDIAIYAPVVASNNPDYILDAIGDYVARRRPVRATLVNENRTDHTATDPDRTHLIRSAKQYALVGTTKEIDDRITGLKNAGADYVIGYPARCDPTL